MAEETPSFSSKNLEDETEDTGQIKNPRKTKAKPKKTAVSNVKQSEIDKQLTSIYRDSNGQLPDMRKIKIKKSHSILKFFFTLIILGGLMAGLAWAGFFILPANKSFSEDQISLNITGPTDVISGATTTYTITYENQQSVPLNEAVLNVQYPEGFVFVSSDLPATNSGNTEWTLGAVGAHKKSQLNITGVTYGSVGQQQSWRVFLTYKPENFNSDLQKASILNIGFGQSPFSLSLTGPDKATIGNSAEYTFTVKKQSSDQINKLELKPSWPANFFVMSSTPSLGKNNSWIFDPTKNTATSTSSSPDTWTFTVAGKFSSSSEQTVSFSGILNVSSPDTTFQIAESDVNTQLIQNNLDFSLAINGSITNSNIQPGGILNITIDLKNLSAGDLKNATLKLDLDTPSIKRQSALDWSQISDGNDGNITGIQTSDSIRRGEIVWNKTKIPDLAKIKPNQDITLDLRLPVKDMSEFDFPSIQSSIINAVAEVDFTDQTGAALSYSANPIIITLASDLKFEDRDSLSSDGKTHDINWVLTNNIHPLKNLLLTADVFGDVDVQIDSSTPAGQANFDQTTKKMTWSIPDMPDGVDVLALPFSITVKTVNPSQDMLISKVHVQADDAVTGQKIDFMGDEILLSH